MILPDPPYDLAKLKEVTQKLCGQLDEIAAGVKDPALRQPIVEAADNYRRMAVDFEREHSQVASIIAEKKAQAQAKLKEAQEKLKEAQEKIAAGKKGPALFEPDWSIAPKMRDEMLACCCPPPPPPARASESLAPFVLSPQPLPPTTLPPPPAAAQSIAAWQAPPGQPAGESTYQSFASWLGGGSPAAEPGKQQPPSSADEWKRWLRKPRGQSP